MGAGASLALLGLGYRHLMTTARDIMTAAPVHLPGETTLDQVAKQLAADDIGMVPICSSEGRSRES